MSNHAAQCDRCGKFFPWGQPGSSWCQTYTHLDLNDPTYRCAKCTEKHGARVSNCNPQAGTWEGTYS